MNCFFNYNLITFIIYIAPVQQTYVRRWPNIEPTLGESLSCCWDASTCNLCQYTGTYINVTDQSMTASTPLSVSSVQSGHWLSLLFQERSDNAGPMYQPLTRN